MKRLLQWINTNKVFLLLLVVAVLLLKPQISRPIPFVSQSRQYDTAMESVGMAVPAAAPMALKTNSIMPMDDYAPSESSDRMVITQTSLSLQVDDVTSAITNIASIAESYGGFLVNSSVNKPNGAASGSISVRVRSDQLSEALSAFKGLAVQVVSENVNGRDVTDQYEDIEAKLVTLNKTKEKFEAILDSAEKVTDILQVQRELTNLQSQIDQLKGRQEYLSQSAKLALVTVYVSTDDLSLPYAPDEVWRPQVVFKQAVRALIGTFRDAADSLIWLFVYLPVWGGGFLIVGIVYYLYSKKMQR